MKLVIGLLSILTASSLFADPAIRITDFGCGLYDGNGGFAFTTETRVVKTSGGPGVTVLKCFADVPNDTGAAVHYSGKSTGVFCGTLFGITDDWHETVSASGKAILTCHQKN
jgi:hypothetical protein